MADTHFSGVDAPTFKTNGVQVLGTQGTAIVSLTNAVGTGSDALQDVTGTFDQTILNDNFKDCTDKIDEILIALRAHGIIAT